MSNLIKSGFVAFSQDNTLVIDANKNKIIKGVDEVAEEILSVQEDTAEEALAEAMILDAGLDGSQFDDADLLSVDAEDAASLSKKLLEGNHQAADEIVKNAKEDAESIISEAYDEAQKLRATAYDEAEQIKRQAQEEGYQQGYSEGMEAANSEIEDKKTALEQRMQELEIQMQEKEEVLTKTVEHKMVDWLCQMIPQITGVVIENQKDVLLYIINAAMRDLDNSKHFVIKVSCDDYEEVAERKEEIYGALNPNIDLEVFEDAKLNPMQCLIETDNGIVDVSLDVQMDNLIKALKLMVKE